MKPILRNLFMKKLTRDRVVPIISARASWLRFTAIGSLPPSLPKSASRSSRRASRLSLELNSWSIRSLSIRVFRDNRWAMKNAENSGSESIVASIADFAIEVIAFLQRDHRCRSPFRAIEAPLAEELALLKNSDDRFLAVIGQHRRLDPPFLKVTDRVGALALIEDVLILSVFFDRYSNADCSKKNPG